MSWATHDLEPYVIKRELGLKVAFFPLLIGSYAPDLLTKWLVYGTNTFGVSIRADNPALFHRGWPGVGFTHSLLFGVLCALILTRLTDNKVIGISFMVGQWAHSISDVGDTVGTMLAFPFSTHRFSLELWAYAGETGRDIDGQAYFSGLGFVWDAFWIVCGFLCWRVLTLRYYRAEIVTNDPWWGWLKSKGVPESAQIIFYRSFFWYGVTRFAFWLIYAHVVHDHPVDLRIGGPCWVHAVSRAASVCGLN